MPWSILRRATDEDTTRLERSARAFAARHAIPLDPGDSSYRANPVNDVEGYIECLDAYSGDRTRLRGLWRAAARRALREPAATGILSGYVGYPVA